MFTKDDTTEEKQARKRPESGNYDDKSVDSHASGAGASEGDASPRNDRKSSAAASAPRTGSKRGQQPDIEDPAAAAGDQSEGKTSSHATSSPGGQRQKPKNLSELGGSSQPRGNNRAAKNLVNELDEKDNVLVPHAERANKALDVITADHRDIVAGTKRLLHKAGLKSGIKKHYVSPAGSEGKKYGVSQSNSMYSIGGENDIHLNVGQHFLDPAGVQKFYNYQNNLANSTDGNAYEPERIDGKKDSEKANETFEKLKKLEEFMRDNGGDMAVRPRYSGSNDVEIVITLDTHDKTSAELKQEIKKAFGILGVPCNDTLLKELVERIITSENYVSAQRDTSYETFGDDQQEETPDSQDLSDDGKKTDAKMSGQDADELNDRSEDASVTNSRRENETDDARAQMHADRRTGELTDKPAHRPKSPTAGRNKPSSTDSEITGEARSSSPQMQGQKHSARHADYDSGEPRAQDSPVLRPKSPIMDRRRPSTDSWDFSSLDSEITGETRSGAPQMQGQKHEVMAEVHAGYDIDEQTGRSVSNSPMSSRRSSRSSRDSNFTDSFSDDPEFKQIVDELLKGLERPEAGRSRGSGASSLAPSPRQSAFDDGSRFTGQSAKVRVIGQADESLDIESLVESDSMSSPRVAHTFGESPVNNPTKNQTSLLHEHGAAGAQVTGMPKSPILDLLGDAKEGYGAAQDITSRVMNAARDGLSNVVSDGKTSSVEDIEQPATLERSSAAQGHSSGRTSQSRM